MTNLTARFIEEAEELIRPYILQTPLLYSEEMSHFTGANTFLKLENRQYTGSFKARGAMHKVLSVKNKQQAAYLSGVKLDSTPLIIITASTGNHGLGVARALQLTNMSGIICIPEGASAVKVAALRQYPIKLVEYGADSLETELFAKRRAEDEGAVWISPYNDPAIIAGQGTIGKELTSQLKDIAAVYVTVGGGGLISGIATWFSEHSPSTEVIACLPENSPEMQMSVEAGHIIHLASAKPTLSDGSAGGLEDGSITFPICQQFIHRYILVSEDEIAKAMHFVYRKHGERIEGAAGVAVASLTKDTERYAGKNVVAIVCGGNIDEEKFRKVIGTV